MNQAQLDMFIRHLQRVDCKVCCSRYAWLMKGCVCFWGMIWLRDNRLDLWWDMRHSNNSESGLNIVEKYPKMILDQKKEVSSGSYIGKCLILFFVLSNTQFSAKCSPVLATRLQSLMTPTPGTHVDTCCDEQWVLNMLWWTEQWGVSTWGVSMTRCMIFWSTRMTPGWTMTVTGRAAGHRPPRRTSDCTTTSHKWSTRTGTLSWQCSESS